MKKVLKSIYLVLKMFRFFTDKQHKIADSHLKREIK